MTAELTLVDELRLRAGRTPDRPAFRTLTSGGAGEDRVWTWADWWTDSQAVATALRARKPGSGSRVAILAGCTPLWPVADLAIQAAGLVSVGLYPTSAPFQVREILSDCGAHTVFVDSPEQYAKVREVAGHLPALTCIVHPDGMPIADRSGPEHRTWSAFLASGRTTPGPEGPDPDADAVLIYTSGSTGAPKGARLTHRTLTASARSIRDTLGLTGEDRSLSFLPYCHAAERIFGLATRIVVGMEAGLVPDPRRVFDAAADFRPTVFGGLPRLYEKVYEAILTEGDARGTRPHRAVERLLGGSVRLATSGGAALPLDVAERLRDHGVTVLGAYGLTEHLCATFNRPGDPALDTSGPPMPGTDLRIAEDGEIQLRRCVLTFAGYHGRPDATAEAFTEDGRWLRTGDLGRLDEAGHLRVTGRTKDLIALSTGKKVAPARIEGWLVEQPWIDQAVLVGEGRKYVSALLSLRRGVVEPWARAHGVEAPWGLAVDDARVVRELDAQVAAVNRRVSPTESVRRFVVLAEPLSVENGELTPTLKVRRDVVAVRHACRIASLYTEAES